MSQPIMIPEVQIDFETLHDAIAMENYCKNELGLNTCISDNPLFLSIFDVPESSLGKIRCRCAIESFSNGTVKIINSSRDAFVGAADFAACRIVAPIAQAGLKATAGVAMVAAKATYTTGATLVGSTLSNIRKTNQELKTDPEVIHAKEELKGAYNSIKNLFGFSSSNSVRIMKD